MSARNDGRDCWIATPGKRGQRRRLPPPTAPSASVARSVTEQLGIGFTELHMLVANPSVRSHSRGIVFHRTRVKWPIRTFWQIDASGMELYVTSPELTFLQLAATSDLVTVIAAGNALCSEYRYDTTARGGVANRAEDGETPWTTPKRLRSFVESHSGEPGFRRAQAALAYIYEGARSPKESGIALACGLPYRLGGYSLGTIQMNPSLMIFTGLDYLGQRQYQERIPDVVVTAKGTDGVMRATAIDYDPWSTHGNPERIAVDMLRRNQIAMVESLTHITLTTAQAENYRLFAKSMDEIRRTLRVRRGPRFGRALSSEERRLKKAQVERRKYKLWEAVIHSSELFGTAGNTGR